MAKASEILQKYATSSLEELSAMMPDTIANELVLLSATLWHAGNKILEAEQAYNRAWIIKREDCATDTACTNFMKTTREYEALQKAKYAEKSIIQLMQSLKKLLRSREMEWQNTNV